MKTLLTTTALVSVLAFAAPAIAGGHHGSPVDVVLNGQFNLASPTSATGVDAYANKVKVNVKNLDVTAIGNLNETVANGGGTTYDSTRSSTKSESDKSFNVSYQKKVKSGSYGSKKTKTTVSASGSAWMSASTRDSSHSATSRNRVFVGSLQVNAYSPTTAVGVDASTGSSSYGSRGKVNVSVNKTTVTAIGNMNSTKLK